MAQEFFKIAKTILAFVFVTYVLETKLFQQAQVNLMLSRFSVLGFVILGTLIGLSGCDQLSSTVKLSGNRGRVEKPVAREVLPLAVLSIAPSEDWSRSFKTMLKNCNKETWVQPETLDQLLSVANSKLPAAGLVYVTNRGAIPVIYLPVVDYDQFLKLVGQRYGLKRGIVSSFDIGRHEMFVRKVGDYAIMGTSEDILNYCKKTPDHYLGDLPERFSCLLYTSPSPRDRQKSRMPSSA